MNKIPFDAPIYDLSIDDTRYLYISSAYVTKKEYAKAFNVLDRKYKPLERKLHATVFQYIENLL